MVRLMVKAQLKKLKLPEIPNSLHETELGKLLYGPFELSNNLHGINSHTRMFSRMLRHIIFVTFRVPKHKKQPNFRIIHVRFRII